MKAYSIVCERVYFKNKVYWRVVRSTDLDGLPVGLLILSTKTAEDLVFVPPNSIISAPYVDNELEEIINNFDSDKMRVQSHVCFSHNYSDDEGYETSELKAYPATIVIEKYYNEHNIHVDHIVMHVTLHTKERRIEVDTNSENVVKLELIVKSINSKLDDLLDNIFFSNESMLSRIISLEKKSERDEKDEYVTKKEFTTIGLFFRSGFVNFIVFILILITFNEIINDGFLRGARITDYIRQHLHIQDD